MVSNKQFFISKIFSSNEEEFSKALEKRIITNKLLNALPQTEKSRLMEVYKKYEALLADNQEMKCKELLERELQYNYQDLIGRLDDKKIFKKQQK